MNTKRQEIEARNQRRIDRITKEAESYNKVSNAADRYLEVKAVFEELASRSEGSKKTSAIVAIDEIDLSQNDREIDTTSEEFIGFKETIETQGLLQRPILTIGLQATKPFLCVAGHRRITALRELGVKEVPSELVAFNSDVEIRMARLAENIARESLHPIDLAAAIKRVAKEVSESKTGLGRLLGKSRDFVTWMLKIADWSSDCSMLAKELGLTTRQLFAIAKQPDQTKRAVLSAIKKSAKKPPSKKGASKDSKIMIRDSYFEAHSYTPAQVEAVVKFLKENQIKGWY